MTAVEKPVHIAGFDDTHQRSGADRIVDGIHHHAVNLNILEMAEGLAVVHAPVDHKPVIVVGGPAQGRVLAHGEIIAYRIGGAALISVLAGLTDFKGHRIAFPREIIVRFRNNGFDIPGARIGGRNGCINAVYFIAVLECCQILAVVGAADGLVRRLSIGPSQNGYLHMIDSFPDFKGHRGADRSLRVRALRNGSLDIPGTGIDGYGRAVGSVGLIAVGKGSHIGAKIRSDFRSRRFSIGNGIHGHGNLILCRLNLPTG